MISWKITAIFLGLFSIGGIQETIRIMTSQNPHKLPLALFALVFTALLIFGARYCWKKSQK